MKNTQCVLENVRDVGDGDGREVALMSKVHLLMVALLQMDTLLQSTDTSYKSTVNNGYACGRVMVMVMVMVLVLVMVMVMVMVMVLVMVMVRVDGGGEGALSPLHGNLFAFTQNTKLLALVNFHQYTSLMVMIATGAGVCRLMIARTQSDQSIAVSEMPDDCLCVAP